VHLLLYLNSKNNLFLFSPTPIHSTFTSLTRSSISTVKSYPEIFDDGLKSDATGVSISESLNSSHHTLRNSATEDLNNGHH
jgi:hypothetical protein